MWSVFEELTHNFQDNFYSGGLRQYGPGKPGYTNMEFEAKLLHAIFHIINATPNGTWLQKVFNGEEWSEVYLWLYDYYYDGVSNDFWVKYNRFIEVFSDKTVYGGFIDNSFPKMKFIESLKLICD